MAAFSYYSPTIRETGILPDDLLEMLHEEDRSPDNPVVCEVTEVLSNFLQFQIYGEAMPF